MNVQKFVIYIFSLKYNFFENKRLIGIHLRW